MKDTAVQKSFVFPKVPALHMGTSVVIFIALLLAASLAYLFTPRLTEVANAPSLDATVPKAFGDWQEVPSPFVQVSLSTGLDPNMDQPYDQVVMRTYINSKGQQVMLALAWGKRQKQEVKIHRPDLCYVAQGYSIEALAPANFTLLDKPATEITGKHMIAMGKRRGEAVAYWLRIGKLYSENAWATRSYIFKEGLAGRIPDGILVRASQAIPAAENAQGSFLVLDSFLSELYAASSPVLRTLMAR